MKKKCHVILLLSLIVGIGVSYAASNKTITVSGKVTDSLGTPIQGAIIFLTADLGVLLAGTLDSTIFEKVDTVSSDSAGAFTTQIVVPATTFLITYAIAKNSYQIEVSAGSALSNTLNLGTIILHKEVLQTITVTGTVVDSVSKQGIENALVVLTNPSMLLNGESDSVTTGTNGKFTTTMEIGTSNIGTIAPMVIYAVIKEGYIIATGTATPVQSVADADTILLQIKDSPIRYLPVMRHAHQKPDGISIYSLKGQLLYRGKVQDMAVLLQKGMLIAQPCVITYFYRNTPAGSQKFMPVK